MPVVDLNGDGRPDVLVADGFAGLRLYRNTTPIGAAKDSVPKFEDITEKAGLAQAGAEREDGDLAAAPA